MGPAEFIGAKTPPIVASLAASGIDVRLRLGGRDRLYEWFAAGAIELGITASEPWDAGLGFVPVFAERLWLVGSCRNVGKGRHVPIDAAAFAALPFVAYDEGLPLIRPYAAAVFRANVEVSARIVAPSLTLVRDLVVEGAGVSVLPDYLCQQALADRRLTLLHRPERDPVNRLFLVWRKAALRHPRTRFVRDRFLAGLGS